MHYYMIFNNFSQNRSEAEANKTRMEDLPIKVKLVQEQKILLVFTKLTSQIQKITKTVVKSKSKTSSS